MLIFPLSQSNSGPDPNFMKKITVRIQSKSNKIRHSPDPVQSKSIPMLISASSPPGPPALRLVLSKWSHDKFGTYDLLSSPRHL